MNMNNLLKRLAPMSNVNLAIIFYCSTVQINNSYNVLNNSGGNLKEVEIHHL